MHFIRRTSALHDLFFVGRKFSQTRWTALHVNRWWTAILWKVKRINFWSFPQHFLVLHIRHEWAASFFVPESQAESSVPHLKRIELAKRNHRYISSELHLKRSKLLRDIFLSSCGLASEPWSFFTLNVISQRSSTELQKQNIFVVHIK